MTKWLMRVVANPAVREALRVLVTAVLAAALTLPAQDVLVERLPVVDAQPLGLSVSW